MGDEGDGSKQRADARGPVGLEVARHGVPLRNAAPTDK